MSQVMELNKKSRDISLILKSVLTDKMKSGDGNDSYVPSNDGEIIAALVSVFKSDASKTNDVLDIYGDSEISSDTPKGLR